MDALFSKGEINDEFYEDLEDILAEIVDTLSTGNVGDGKVFISDIEDVMRIRTGERGKHVL